MGGSIPKNKIQTTTIRKEYTREKFDVAFTKKFCITILLKISEGVRHVLYEALDGAVYLDPHKAFVRLLKQGLLKKLSCFGERERQPSHEGS